MAKPKRRDDLRFSVRDNPEAKIWDHFPDPWVAEDLRQEVIRTGMPDGWKWHCHSAPPADSPVPKVCAEGIDVPERLRQSVGRAPCPLCSIHGPKYFHGILVWYPEEKALRVIGHECARKFYGDDFDKEIMEARLKRSDDATIDFLIDNIETISTLRRSVTALRARARTMDEVRRKVVSTITKLASKRIYRETSLDGLLKLYETYSVTTFQQGRENEKLARVIGSYPLAGREILISGDMLSEAMLNGADTMLAAIDFGDDDAILNALNTLGIEGRQKAWEDLCNGWDLIIKAHTLCKQTQDFLRAENLERLVTWANDPRAPISIKCWRDSYGKVWFENQRRRYSVIPNSAEVTSPLPEVPNRHA